MNKLTLSQLSSLLFRACDDLHGGVPKAEIDALDHHWSNYPGLRERCFAPRAGDDGYFDFGGEVSDRRSLADIVNLDPSVKAAHQDFLETLDAWWKTRVPEIESIAPANSGNGGNGNVYALRRSLLASIEPVFADNPLLTGHQIRGAFARWLDELKADLKSSAASGWGPELIPDSDILKSQFPEVLAEMEANRTRLAELNALFASAGEQDFEDEDGTGVLPKDQVKELKARLKEAKGWARIAKKERERGDWENYTRDAQELEKRLARHKALEDEARRIKAELRAAGRKQDDLVATARRKIGRDEARRVILERLRMLLVETYEAYLRTDQRTCLAAVEKLHDKYAVTMKEIEVRRDAATGRLRGLGYV